jgi:Peptidase_C39 like family
LIAAAAHLITAAAVIVTAAAAVPQAGARREGALHLLDVPYLPQSEALCGGAAVAMVMRYWGATNVYPEAFADLVDPTAQGIRGEDLLKALHSRGWQAASFKGDPALVQSHLAEGRPVVALIQDRPGRYHYVVIVGWSRGRVITHDPARAPFRVVGDVAFGAAWSETGSWTLVVTPPASGNVTVANDAERSPPAASERARGAAGPGPGCDGMVAEGVRLAGADDFEGARRILEVAAESCPASAAPWREMAGLHALRRQWRDAAEDARRALMRDRADPLAARILATALYLEGNPDDALDAWNDVGEPVVDLVNVTGLDRTRYLVAARTVGLQPRTLLTRAALQRARRRLAELPASQTTRVGYRPGDNGRAQVDAVVLERSLLPSSPVLLAAMGIRAITDRELSAGLSSPSGGGELWTAAWRWWEHRPRAAVGLAAPAPFGGVWGVDGFGERQTYASAGSTLVESRTRAGFHVSDWTRTGFRWDAGIALDRWRHTGRAVSLALSGHQRLAGDRAHVEARAAAWRGGVRAWTLDLRTEWRSHVRHEGTVWIGRAGVQAAADGSPLALWPGAGTGQGRDVLLRAHPLLDGGIIDRGVFGRRLAHGGAEWRRWLQPARKPLRIAPALFVDTARASAGLESSNRRWHTDAGAGLRIALPGAGAVRIDLARGLRDGSMALSAGWTR